MFPPPSSSEDGSVVRSRILLVAFAASASLALVLASSVAVAQSGDSDDDGVPDGIENATQRNVVAVAAGDEFDISSRLASAPYEDRFMRVGNRVLTPMEVKLDLTVNRVFVATNANLGLDLGIGTGDRWAYADRSWDDLNGFAPDDAAINVTGRSANSPARVFFSWSKSAFADGRQIPVTFSSAADGNPNRSELYLAYPMGASQPSVKLVHDPVLGVDSAAYEGIISRQPPLQGDALVYGVSLAAMAVLIAVTIVLANRRRKKREELGRNP